MRDFEKIEGIAAYLAIKRTTIIPALSITSNHVWGVDSSSIKGDIITGSEGLGDARVASLGVGKDLL